MEQIRKAFITLLIISAMPFALFSQEHSEHQHEHNASWFVGGVASVWHDNSEKSTSIHLHPEFGYFLNNDWAVGFLLGYGLHSHSNEAKEHEVKVAPFVRYYYVHREPFNLYLDGSVGFNAKKHGSEKWDNGFEVGIRPGACLDLTEGICLCLRMGFIGYRKNYFAGEEPGISANGFGVHFTPEELMIGIEIEF